MSGLKDLIDISLLEAEQIEQIMTLASKYEEGLKKGEVKSDCRGKSALFMFFENSTRTRVSFEMACHHLGVNISNFEVESSSLEKNESSADTIKILEEIGIDAIILRNKEPFMPDFSNARRISLINAGFGCISHPTQALLDYYTMKKHLGTVEGKNIVIVGDILHSRVARSNIDLLSQFGANIICCAPEYFMNKKIKNVTWSNNLKECLEIADVTMCLRIQKERIEENIPFEEYVEYFQVNENNINKKSLLMHPGPVNRDIELSSELLDSKQGQTIFEQARNGVFVRMAVLNMVLGGAK